MAINLWDSVFVAASLSWSVNLEECHAREYLTTLSDADANSLWKCLRRLGWWFPDDQQSPQERLVWWLFRGDVKRLDFSDGTERQRIETPEERLADAVRHLKSLTAAATIPSGSCLSVAGFVRGVLGVLERNAQELPLGHPFIQCGSPDDFRFDISRIRFDGECLNDAMNAAAIQLDLPPGRLEWQDATGHPFTTERRAFADVRWLFTGWRDVLEREIQTRGELPPGWEATDTTWPDCPIKTVEHLRDWLSSWLGGIHQARSSSRSNPESYFDDVQRELRNARRSMRAWGIPLPPEFNDQPADIHEAERQLELLIDAAADGDETTEATSEPPKPVERQTETLAGGEGAGGGQPQLKPCEGKAWSQFQEAVGKNSELTTDRQTYDWFVDEIADDAGELPSFANWSRYVRAARKAMNQGKNGPRMGNETRSVVSAKRIEADR